MKKILTKYDHLVANQPTANTEMLLAFDEERDQYLWFQVGWNDNQRVLGITVHVNFPMVKSIPENRAIALSILLV
ncbi:element excision factor XisI family protein [Coleofasciculus sp.]|uniref:element excision factor XisI family protein n=1 Tax=Coleofasciculus sp. TaxID=3100458 RepID=UPI003A339487